MRIDENLCIACEVCLPYCPLGVISMKGDIAVIDREECVECGACFRSQVCPVDAFVDEESPYPRSIRANFSNPLLSKPVTGLAGRGTEEMKTNDVTGRFKKGRVGLGIEPGRPGTGARFRDVEKITKAMAKLGAHFEPQNPISSLMTNVKTGELRKEILNEKVMSCVIECDFPAEQMTVALKALEEVAKQVDCAFSIACIGKAESDGFVPVEKMLKDLKVPYYINSKNNVGLGRPLAEGDR
jgi:NAD-dependent dihydropyrimidine dehydrogenase PreA subunit